MDDLIHRSPVKLQKVRPDLPAAITRLKRQGAHDASHDGQRADIGEVREHNGRPAVDFDVTRHGEGNAAAADVRGVKLHKFALAPLRIDDSHLNRQTHHRTHKTAVLMALDDFRLRDHPDRNRITRLTLEYGEKSVATCLAHGEAIELLIRRRYDGAALFVHGHGDDQSVRSDVFYAARISYIVIFQVKLNPLPNFQHRCRIHQIACHGKAPPHHRVKSRKYCRNDFQPFFIKTFSP